MLSKLANTIKKSDYVLLIAVFIATIIGLIFIISATNNLDNHIKYPVVQCIALFLGICCIYVIGMFNYEDIASISWLITAGYSILLILVLILGTGKSSTGTQGWFYIGSIGIQPAELAKIGFIIALSRQLDNMGNRINEPLNILKLLIHLAIPVGLIMLQPDFGTALVFVFIFIVMLFISEINWKYIVGALGIGIVTIYIGWNFLLKDYQINRILDFLNPSDALSASGYQVEQAKIAIGSGMIFGKGLFKGTQTQMGFLPERHTDFIFSVIGEEGGLIMCLVVVALLIFIISRCIYNAVVAKNKLGMLICVGVAAMFTFHTFENICMNMGLMPVTGIPLSFISYGGSSLVTNLIAIGLVNNIKIRKRIINF